MCMPRCGRPTAPAVLRATAWRCADGTSLWGVVVVVVVMVRA